nr:hypothetical protein 8 [bacterium]
MNKNIFKIIFNIQVLIAVLWVIFVLPITAMISWLLHEPGWVNLLFEWVLFIILPIVLNILGINSLRKCIKSDFNNKKEIILISISILMTLWMLIFIGIQLSVESIVMS